MYYYLVSRKTIKLCKESAILLQEFIVDEIHGDPSRKKELLTQLRKVDKLVEELKKYIT